MNPVVATGGIVAAVGAAQMAARIPVSRWGRARRKRVLAALQTECDLGRDRIVIGPLAAVYNGASARYSSIAGNATVVLTEQKLLWIKRTGTVVEVSRSRIVGTRMTARFNGRAEAGRRHLVIQTSDPAELGMYVADPGRWEATLDLSRTATRQ